MSNQYYGDQKVQYTRPTAAPPPAYQDRGQPQYIQPQYAQSQPQYSQPQYYPPQGQPQYYQHVQPTVQVQPQPIYVQQQPPTTGNEDCMAACLAAMCVCCALDMIF